MHNILSPNILLSVLSVLSVVEMIRRIRMRPIAARAVLLAVTVLAPVTERVTGAPAAVPTPPKTVQASPNQGGTTMAAAATSRGRVIYNLDCSEYFVNTFGPIVPETIDKFVNEHAAAGVTDLFINVNAQRTNYRSAVWESYWDGYDPKADDKQPFFAGIDLVNRPWDTLFYINTYRLYQQGCDYPQRMIDRCRYDHVSPWISLRMNDAHEPGVRKHPIHSTFWESHPEWWLANGGLDYEQPEVRELYLKLVREVCSRYDVDGIELDYERFWLYFRPGREHAGAHLMTEFVAAVRAATQAAAQRLGHPVQLAVRVPTTPWIARRHGLDAVAWGNAGLVDLVIASPFWHSLCSDIPIETWKGELSGTAVQVAFSQEDGINSGASGRRTATPEEVRGVVVSCLQRGAAAAYFFNLFTGPYHNWPREDYEQLLRDAGDYATLCAAPRRQALTIINPWSAGEPGADRYLPYTGTAGVFRLHIGPVPAAQQKAWVELVTASDEQRPEVRVNGTPCPWSRLAPADHIAASGWKAAEPKRQVYDVPLAALDEGYNLIEVNAAQAITVNWVEITIR
jgi:hypothetical protein